MIYLLSWKIAIGILVDCTIKDCRSMMKTVNFLLTMFLVAISAAPVAAQQRPSSGERQARNRSPPSRSNCDRNREVMQVRSGARESVGDV
jgi:hypothetical protein